MGWTEGSGRSVPAVLASVAGLALGAIVVTAIEQDGTLEGPDLEGLGPVLDATEIPVIASGGVGSVDDLEALAKLRSPEAGRALGGVVVGKALLDERIDLEEATRGVRTVRVIPCLDVTDGRVVKGVRFVDLVDAGDPVELAARYDSEGADEVTFLDITASAAGRETMVDVVARTAEQVFIPFTVGGGVRSVEDARRLLRAGAEKVSVNTAAVERPELVAEIWPTNSGRSASWWRSTPGRGRRAAAGRSARTAGARRRGSTRSPGCVDVRPSAPARSCSRRWTATARGSGSTWRSPARSSTPSPSPWWPPGGSGRSTTWSRGPPSAAPTPCSPPRSSTVASTRWPRPRPT